jgi:trypsin
MGATDYAVLGEHDIEVVNDGDGEVFAVREVILHPDYSQMLMSMYGLADNDFMLVFLEGASASDDVITVKLNSDTSLPIVGQSVTVMGWGDTDISDDFDDETPNDVETSTVLMNVDVSVISNEECDASEGYIDGTYATYSGRITANMLCAISNGKDSCQGDSGGPMVIKGADGPADVQVGVVSWAYGCAIDQFPGVYARVSRAYDWIQIEVCKGSSYASEAGFDCGSIIDDSDGSATPPITQPTNPPILAPTGGLPTNDYLCTSCPNGSTAGDDAALPPPSSAPPMDLIDNTCIICPGGASAGEDFAPYADLDGMLDFIGSLFGFGDSRTCGDLIEAAKQYNTGSEWCGLSEMHELHCCPTVPENPCIICPNGATAGDDFVPQYEGNTLTCKDIIDYDNQYEAESDYCGFIGKYDELYCCPEEDVMSTPSPTLSPAEGSEGTVHTADNPCIICPDGATAGDDFAPYTDSGNSMTCGELIDAAKSYEAHSAWCGLRSLDAVYCCPTAPANPCIICPFGAFAGDDFVLRPSTGSTTTCREIIDLAMRFESGSQYCKLNEADEALCCPLVEGITVAPSPTEITSSSPTSGSATPLSPTSVSPAGYAFLSAVPILYIFAL